MTLRRANDAFGPVRKLSASVAFAVAIAYSAGVIGDGARSGNEKNRVEIEYAGRRLSPSAPEVILGDRLFFETRFAEYFMTHSYGDVNAELAVGDPVVDDISRLGRSSLRGPFRGQSMSCRQCHLGDDFAQAEPRAQRTYCDFTARSEVPARDDGLTRTVRNSPVLVDLGLPSEAPFLLHLDGEFATVEDLVLDTLTGRNFGWVFGEQAIARTHLARVIREDKGRNPRGLKWNKDGHGIPYRIALLGIDREIPEGLRIPADYRVNVLTATDDEVIWTVARLIHAYLDSLRFGVEDTFRESGSPYDLFLAKNGLPSRPDDGESTLAYARRFRDLISRREKFLWVTEPQDGKLFLHDQAFKFAEAEFAGLEVFLSEPGTTHRRVESIGNCVVCHTPPRFTDNRFHNTGVSQLDYDGVFGAGAFARLAIPSLYERNRRPNKYLPASRLHPNAESRFRVVPFKSIPGFADLGVWNIFANPDFPRPQSALTRTLCDVAQSDAVTCGAPDQLLSRTIGLFKTPTIRDLGHSEPYFHSGEADSIGAVLRHYRKASDLARAGRIRNPASELSVMHITLGDILNLEAFLRALNEDYH
jgi:cytochrome c peroxidase